MKNRIIIIVIVVLFCINGKGYSISINDITIIPKPSKIEVKDEEGFSINSKTVIVYDSTLTQLAKLLSNTIYKPTALKLECENRSRGKRNTITLRINSEITNKEGYILDITSKGVCIEGKTRAGVFYGVQSLLQLLPAKIASKELQELNLILPAVRIIDEPQYEWRGVMLDVSRYFFTKEYIFKFIDLMAIYKMNILHLHLIDDAGWRLEIKKYPLLTSVGSFRGEGDERTGGYYTHEDIKEIVNYGLDRGVEIVPELEFPAHILSAIVAYPWLSCRNEQLKVPTQHYISKDLICVGQERSMQFLEDVIKETCELFPSKYLHIGGDEAVYTYWEDCPHCQKIVKDKGLSKTSDLQSYLTNRVAAMAKKYNRIIVGWNEILERGKLDGKVVSMIWRPGVEKIEEALEGGHSVVMSPSATLYLDFPASNLPGEIKAAKWQAPRSIEDCYNYDTSNLEGRRGVLGVEAGMWTDQFIHGTLLQEIELLNENRSEKYVEYLLLPRLLAIAEVGWSSRKNRNYSDFSNRIIEHFPRLEYADYNFRIPPPEVKSKAIDGGYIVELSTTLRGAEIYYTTNGERATTYDNKYTEPIKVVHLSDIRAITALSKTHHSVSTYYKEDLSAYAKYGKFVSMVSGNKLKRGVDNEITIDFTGKFVTNGNYEITLIPINEGVNMKIEQVIFFKRNDKFAEISINSTLRNEPITLKVNVSEWQAGTSFKAKIGSTPEVNHAGNFVVFINRVR